MINLIFSKFIELLLLLPVTFLSVGGLIGIMAILKPTRIFIIAGVLAYFTL
ncbi:hypothetical protein ACIQD3_24455 [Peribacillus loiseleuriae]|uniref:hypothetical protein n=1 Tax=Peribacillus loiseleuriae TaxID=1679170 RepID=UPI00382291D7